MARKARTLSGLVAALALGSLQACAGGTVSIRPTVPPDIRVTPAASRQNVPATATAFARQVVPTPTPAGLYIVKPGDTLTKIADDHATTIDEIMALNNLSDPNTIVVGQKLLILSPAPPTEAALTTPEATAEAAATAEAGPDTSPERAAVPSLEATGAPSPEATTAP